jgi:hypothetical protein
MVTAASARARAGAGAEDGAGGGRRNGHGGIASGGWTMEAGASSRYPLWMSTVQSRARERRARRSAGLVVAGAWLGGRAARRGHAPDRSARGACGTVGAWVQAGAGIGD